jgi:hypothetical protein
MNASEAKLIGQAIEPTRYSIELFIAALTISSKNADKALLKPEKSDESLKGQAQVPGPTNEQS